jgi:hypothetical protein
VFVIGAGVLAVALFVALSEAARSGIPAARTVAIVEAVGTLILSSLGVLLALYLAAARCDESCDERPGEWWHTTDAWQWWAQFGAALLGSAAILAAVVLIATCHHRRASAAMVAAAAFYGAWAAFLAPLGNGLGI